jgi:hypothetical protein
MPPERAASKLRELGEDEVASALLGGGGSSQTFSGGYRRLVGLTERPWMFSSHALGFIAPLDDSELHAVQHAGAVESDRSLIGSRVKITLGRLNVADYPGGGTHFVLLDFYGQNQLAATVEDLRYTTTVRAREGQAAPVINYPIFNGLSVGSEGVAFRCRTVNVKNAEDEAFLGFLETDAFKAGLKVATTVQPAVRLLSDMVLGVTKGIATRNRNVAVQEIDLGLDFGRNAFGARLREGAYVAVQVPAKLHVAWDWDRWRYSARTGEIVSSNGEHETLPYNYVVLGVSRLEDG